MKKYKNIFSSFHTIYRLITASVSMENYALGVTRLYRNVFNADKAVFMYKNSTANTYTKIKIENKNQNIKKGGQGIFTRVEKEIFKQEQELFSMNRLIYPLTFTNTMGVIYVKRNSAQNSFSDQEKKWFISLSEEISIGLKIFNLYEEEQKLLLNYVKSLSDTLNQYVPTSSLHTKNITFLIRIFAKEMRLSELEIKSLEHSLSLHDAGKIQVPTQILKKQRKLTDAEYNVIKNHPREGVELIKDVKMLKPIIPIILHHHEKFDGTGYPSRLKGEQIPLCARILSIIDAFDAMFFGRPYKKRRQLKNIENEFKKQSGKQFDPKIVAIFLKLLKRKSVYHRLRLAE